MRRICVYCGARAGDRPVYRQAAHELAAALVADGIGLVYGGGSVGLMGELADAMIELGGEAIGVVPRALVHSEPPHDGLSELHIVESMHERKALMSKLSEAFVALPGGSGTLDELFEAFTWTQLGIHRKACCLLNVDGYYDPLVAFLDHAVREGFLDPADRSTLLVESDPVAALRRVVAWEPLPAWRLAAHGDGAPPVQDAARALEEELGALEGERGEDPREPAPEG